MDFDNDWPEWDPNYGFGKADDDNDNKPVDPDSWAGTKDDWEGDY